MAGVGLDDPRVRPLHVDKGVHRDGKVIIIDGQDIVDDNGQLNLAGFFIMQSAETEKGLS